MKSFIVSGFVLAAISVPGIAQNVSPAMQQLLDAKDDARCKSMGAKPGSTIYTTCRLQQQQMRFQSMSANQAAVPVARPVYVPMQIFQPQPPVQSYQLPMPQMPRQSTNCTSQRSGDTVYTNCN